MSWTSVGNYCRDIVLRVAGDRYYYLALIALIWKDIVGDILAERSAPEKYEHHVLFVKVLNSTWMQELILIKPMIISRLNDNPKLQVNDIVFIIGRKRGR